VYLPVVHVDASLPHCFNVCFAVELLPIFNTKAITLLEQVIGVALFKVVWLEQRLSAFVGILDSGTELFKE